MAQFDHPGIVKYYSTWIERPPEGFQVRITDYFAQLHNSIQYEADRSMFEKIDLPATEYVRLNNSESDVI